VSPEPPGIGGPIVLRVELAGREEKLLRPSEVGKTEYPNLRDDLLRFNRPLMACDAIAIRRCDREKDLFGTGQSLRGKLFQYVG
jgi:hypothetical protein